MEGLIALLGIAMIAGNIFASVYLFGGWRSSPQWVVILASVMNILVLLSALNSVM